jgi:putative sigma-54 modulation protein
MQLDITGRHVDITPAIRQLIERRLARIERLLNDSLVSVKGILTLEKYRPRTEIIVHARGDHTLRGLGEGNAWTLSVRMAVAKLEQQALTVKGKWAERKRGVARRRTARETRAEAGVRAADTDGARPKVIRARYAVKPMSIEDASVRLETSAESFLVFRNADTEAVGIVYRRKDGQLGLIEPD